jgi:hypothetical protein
MPVIGCPDCNGKVSDSAPSCPHCGRPMKQTALPVAPAVQPALPPKVQTIEKTGKKWKGMGCVGALLILGGAATIYFSMASVRAGGEVSTGAVVLGSLSVFVGLIIAVVAKIGAWWHHE